MLETMGYIVIVANTGEEALDTFQNNSIHLILMDIDLGLGIDGTEVAEKILKDHDVPIIFLSSHTETEVVEKTEKITSYGYVVKGTGITVLDASIKMAFKLFDSRKKELEKEKALYESEQKYRNIYDNSLEGIYRISLHGKIIHANKAMASILGYDSPSELINTITDAATQIWFDPKERSDLIPIIEKQNIITFYECRFKRKDGSVIWVSLNTRAVRDNDQKIICFDGFIEDITKRKRAEKIIQQNESRLKRVVDILQHQSDSVQNFLDYALDQVVQLTKSKFGYIYHYHEDRKEFELNTWSKEVMPECKVVNPLTFYKLEKTGIWGEAVRQRKPIIVNDFQSANPLKKGYPEGHVQLTKFMTVPIFMNDKIVCVVGLANKQNDYNETDVLQASLLMDAVWKVTTKIKMDETLRKNENFLRLIADNIPVYISYIDQNFRYCFVNKNGSSAI